MGTRTCRGHCHVFLDCKGPYKRVQCWESSAGAGDTGAAARGSVLCMGARRGHGVNGSALRGCGGWAGLAQQGAVGARA